MKNQRGKKLREIGVNWESKNRKKADRKVAVYRNMKIYPKSTYQTDLIQKMRSQTVNQLKVTRQKKIHIQDSVQK